MRRASATWYPSRTESRAALRMEASDEEDISPSLSKSSISESIRWRTLEDLMRSPFLLLGPLLRGSRNHPYSPHSLRGMSAVHVVRASCPCQEMLKTARNPGGLVLGFINTTRCSVRLCDCVHNSGRGEYHVEPAGPAR